MIFESLPSIKCNYIYSSFPNSVYSWYLILPEGLDSRIRINIHMNTINKAAAIRELLDELGRNIPTKTVIARLKTQGISVTPQQVSNQKAKLTRVMPFELEDLPVSVLKRVKKFVDEIGSIEVVKRALTELDELAKRR
jgi:hypothetical protein